MKYGVINVYKEAGMTSFQVVYQIRRLTGEKKIGHTGTLDPDATGVLPVCIGKATKLVDFLMDTDKQYRAVMRFGMRTDTQDISGEALETMEEKEVKERLSEEKIREAFSAFTGRIEQLPPMYSAVKVAGVKLVDAARKGREIDRKSRPVTIHSFEDICVTGLSEPGEPVRTAFTVNCSKGTYVRTLCEDMGAFLQVPACLESLERTRTGGMELSGAHTLKEIEEAKEKGTLEDLIVPTDRFLLQHPKIIVKDSAVRKLVFGNYLPENEIAEAPAGKKAGLYRVYDTKGTFYAIYRYDPRAGVYKCDKMFVDEPDSKRGDQ